MPKHWANDLQRSVNRFVFLLLYGYGGLPEIHIRDDDGASGLSMRKRSPKKKKVQPDDVSLVGLISQWSGLANKLFLRSFHDRCIKSRNWLFALPETGNGVCRLGSGFHSQISTV